MTRINYNEILKSSVTTLEDKTRISNKEGKKIETDNNR